MRGTLVVKGLNEKFFNLILTKIHRKESSTKDRLDKIFMPLGHNLNSILNLESIL